MDEVSDIDAEGKSAKRDIEKAAIKVNLIKQANNTFRSIHQPDVARAKIEGYESSFLDEEE